MMDDKKKTLLSAKGELRLAFRNYSIAQESCYLASRATEEWECRHHCWTGIIFTSFAVEAMINHYSEIVFENFDPRVKTNRKDSHKVFFEKVNLTNYLGSTTYQTIKECFDIRDNIAHGYSSDEPFQIPIDTNIEIEKNINHVMSEPLGIENKITIQNLEKFMKAAEQIQKDIERCGYYPNQEYLPLEQRLKLTECALTLGGSRTWEYTS